MRLNRYLALATGVSRRAADQLITQARVSVNDHPAKLGYNVNLDDTVTLDGVPAKINSQRTYLMLNKPANYICSRRQQGVTPTIYQLLSGSDDDLKPVGRLDRETTGLLLMTNDGDLAFQLTHPSRTKTKTYEILLNRTLSRVEAAQLKTGIELEDGLSRFDSLSGGGKSWIATLHGGRNRQIRRTFAAIGAEVVSLNRTGFGNLTLGSLPVGHFRYLDQAEIQ